MEPQRKKSFLTLLALLAVFGSIPLLWPEDAPWINDEPRLIEMAMRHKETGTPAAHGLPGSRGLVYGPVPVWIYTALLHISGDLADLVRWRAFWMTAVTALSPSRGSPDSVMAFGRCPAPWLCYRPTSGSTADRSGTIHF